MKKSFLIVAALIMVFVLGVGVVSYLSSSAPSSLSEQNQSEHISISLSISGVAASTTFSVSSKDTLLSFMERLNTLDPTIKLETKEYAGLGTLIVAMGGIQNGTEGKYWQYKVNGVLPQIGAGSYQLKDKDVIEWFFDVSDE